MSKEMRDRLDNKQCPACGKPKDEWTRRIDWNCCSSDCTTKFNKETIFGWGQLREKVFERDKHLCVKCGKEFPSYGLIGDHITPIALGGEQWDMDNIQTLCETCDKIKTKQDHADIGKARRKEKLESKGQKTLNTAFQNKENEVKNGNTKMV